MCLHCVCDLPCDHEIGDGSFHLWDHIREESYKFWSTPNLAAFRLGLYTLDLFLGFRKVVAFRKTKALLNTQWAN